MALLGSIEGFEFDPEGLAVMVSLGPGGLTDHFDFFDIGQHIRSDMFFVEASGIMGGPGPLDDRLAELDSLTPEGVTLTVEDGSFTWSVPVPGVWNSEYFYAVTTVGVVEGLRELPMPLPEIDGTLIYT